MTTTGKQFWRTLDELADEPSFRERLYNEFPTEVETITDPTTRRTFLKLMGASLALAGVTACTRQPEEKIVPYVRQPEELVPGKPMFFATAMTLGGVATGLVVESHEGRPTKIEGNPLHPASLGAADTYAQGEVLSLYDPDRVRTLTELGDIRPWSALVAMLRAALMAQGALQGAGLRILTETVNSPTLGAQIQELLGRFPSAKWVQWEPAQSHNTRAGARLAFGEYASAHYKLESADVIVSLDADFLGQGPASLRLAREFAARRKPEEGARMNRLYVIETTASLTGARADHRLPLKPSEIPALAAQLAAGLGVGSAAAASGESAAFVTALVKDLQAHRGRSVVIAGEGQPPAVHALAHAINQALGNNGQTVAYTQAPEVAPIDQVAALRELVADMDGGKVDLLLILGGNPVYTAPADLNFAAALDKVQTRVRLGLYEDETSERCQWQVPDLHFLESWSDARAFDGTASIVQPLIAPLYGGHSAHDVLTAMSNTPERTAYEVVREFWATQLNSSIESEEFSRVWRKALHDGIVPNTAFEEKTVALGALPALPAVEGSGLEVVFRVDPSTYDGRYANNGWLQELPKPITRLTWDNAVLASPATIKKLEAEGRIASRGGEHGQIVSEVVELKLGTHTVQGAIFAMPGHAPDSVTVHLGYGRTRAGHVGTGTGFNAYAIRTSDGLWSASGLSVTATGETYSLACTQYHHLMEGRGMVRAVTLAEFTANPESVHEGFEAPPRTLTLYPEFKYEGYKWGMSIDVNACIGCNACVIGCTAENNIPVIGKDQVMRGREMHWLRVDTYYAGNDPEALNPETYFQPVPCMQCENAPCEVVCPVGATVHSHEGLNDMVYNRCVGTRYCSNNCPYKVRRFNYLLYQDFDTPSLKAARNPDVSVRSRGVMEKCTYCVQRINAAKIDSEKGNRRIADGEIKTACQQTCPTDAIVFGDLNDMNSRVAHLQQEERNYSLLAELNTRPRTTYLAAVRNPNPELAE